MKALALLLTAALVASCTTTSTIRVAADRSVITTRGNAFTSAEVVQRDLLLQAAHQAQGAGYEWFVIESSRNVTTRGVLMLPAHGDADAGGNAAGWSGSASYTGASYMPYTKPGEQVTVRFGSGEKPPGALVAAQIIALNPTR